MFMKTHDKIMYFYMLEEKTVTRHTKLITVLFKGRRLWAKKGRDGHGVSIDKYFIDKHIIKLNFFIRIHLLYLQLKINF